MLQKLAIPASSRSSNEGDFPSFFFFSSSCAASSLSPSSLTSDYKGDGGFSVFYKMYVWKQVDVSSSDKVSKDMVEEEQFES